MHVCVCTCSFLPYFSPTVPLFPPHLLCAPSLFHFSLLLSLICHCLLLLSIFLTLPLSVCCCVRVVGLQGACYPAPIQTSHGWGARQPDSQPGGLIDRHPKDDRRGWRSDSQAAREKDRKTKRQLAVSLHGRHTERQPGKSPDKQAGKQSVRDCQAGREAQIETGRRTGMGTSSRAARREGWRQTGR